MLTLETLQKRQKCVNASEMASILCNPLWSKNADDYVDVKYKKSPYILFHEKKTLKDDMLLKWQDINTNKYGLGGHRDEEEVINVFFKKYPSLFKSISNTQKYCQYQDLISATLDTILLTKNDEEFVVEIKSPFCRANQNILKEHYIQLITQLLCSNINKGSVVVAVREREFITDNNPVIDVKFASYLKAKETKTIDDILRASENFLNWLELNQEPRIGEGELDKKMEALINRNTPITIIDDTLYNNLHQIGSIDLTEERKKLEKQEKIIKEIIKSSGYATTIFLQNSQGSAIQLETKSNTTSFATKEYVNTELIKIQEELNNLDNPEWIETFKETKRLELLAKQSNLSSYFDGEDIILRNPNITKIKILCNN